jgi:hypothetical protein
MFWEWCIPSETRLPNWLPTVTTKDGIHVWSIPSEYICWWTCLYQYTSCTRWWSYRFGSRSFCRIWDCIFSFSWLCVLAFWKCAIKKVEMFLLQKCVWHKLEKCVKIKKPICPHIIWLQSTYYLFQPPFLYPGYESSAERWSPVQSIEKILLSVVSMLAEPNDESAANVSAAKMWREDRKQFEKMADRCVCCVCVCVCVCVWLIILSFLSFNRLVRKTLGLPAPPPQTPAALLDSVLLRWMIYLFLYLKKLSYWMLVNLFFSIFPRVYVFRGIFVKILLMFLLRIQ